ncbi:MAG TPA: acyl-CoA dehydrogenase family protein [Solirubrobacteraceae bacterium]|nr:acyl-CoA dehydrogenase family protein [Solirubrobacteraceae bacterium]
MNFALTDEQMLLREAARGSLARVKTVEAARTALEDPSALPDLWPVAVEAGWPGVLIDEDRGGAGLGGFDALLVAEECGRVLAAVPLLGLLPATAILNAAGDATLDAVAAGELRPAYVPARPPGELEPGWTVEPAAGFARSVAPRVTGAGDEVTVDGAVAWVPDAPGADLLVVVGLDDGGEPVAAAIESGADGVAIEAVVRYDATRSLGHVSFTGARGRRLDVDAGVLADAWYLAHALIAAESIGTVQTCLDVSVAYAKERFTFGRAIGSYQAIKHELTEILRRLENARGLEYYAGWARKDRPEEFPLAASAARSAAGAALDFAARAMINVHGGIGATWEHDAPLFFRRAQLSRRLLAGTHDATDRVAECTMAAAPAAA